MDFHLSAEFALICQRSEKFILQMYGRFIWEFITLDPKQNMTLTLKLNEMPINTVTG